MVRRSSKAFQVFVPLHVHLHDMISYIQVLWFILWPVFKLTGRHGHADQGTASPDRKLFGARSKVSRPIAALRGGLLGDGPIAELRMIEKYMRVFLLKVIKLTGDRFFQSGIMSLC